MAVDTREKRASLISWARPWAPMPPLPDNEIGTNDRYQLAWLYRFPADIQLIFVRCPPALTIQIFYPSLTAEFTTPALSAGHNAPTLSAQTLEPSLGATYTTPDLEAEVCPS